MLEENIAEAEQEGTRDPGTTENKDTYGRDQEDRGYRFPFEYLAEPQKPLKSVSSSEDQMDEEQALLAWDLHVCGALYGGV